MSVPTALSREHQCRRILLPSSHVSQSRYRYLPTRGYVARYFPIRTCKSLPINPSDAVSAPQSRSKIPSRADTAFNVTCSSLAVLTPLLTTYYSFPISLTNCPITHSQSCLQISLDLASPLNLCSAPSTKRPLRPNPKAEVC